MSVATEAVAIPNLALFDNLPPCAVPVAAVPASLATVVAPSGSASPDPVAALATNAIAGGFRLPEVVVAHAPDSAQ